MHSQPLPDPQQSQRRLVNSKTEHEDEGTGAEDGEGVALNEHGH
eukprot:CAMPEP_0175977794 /NCGR_PEP_ID=MMETSP0108-20121206/45279_1 /TAXON_ID=195067 ORGANISM="Goniomonas pacifica, Strain CCMP1869" /NCGR_SAMPLE_ID=MMETSP0108 /ASSEMBLY_ACC=CAM_ASM_000204 /LENGTH=43 /DNA_ID= /DNA_START= /DNA_END= /DNA_ORIENTATION=